MLDKILKGIFEFLEMESNYNAEPKNELINKFNNPYFFYHKNHDQE